MTHPNIAIPNTQILKRGANRICALLVRALRNEHAMVICDSITAIPENQTLHQFLEGRPLSQRATNALSEAAAADNVLYVDDFIYSRKLFLITLKKIPNLGTAGVAEVECQLDLQLGQFKKDQVCEILSNMTSRVDTVSISRLDQPVPWIVLHVELHEGDRRVFNADIKVLIDVYVQCKEIIHRMARRLQYEGASLYFDIAYGGFTSFLISHNDFEPRLIAKQKTPSGENVKKYNLD